MRKTIICISIAFAGVLFLLHINTSSAAELTIIPEADHPDACEQQSSRERCGRWYYLTELDHPDSWNYERYNDKRQRWYGVAAAPKERTRVIIHSEAELKGILFDFDKYTIRPEFMPVLDKDVQELKGANVKSAKIIGHADHIGTDAYNQKLSERRANAVMNYFISKGISPGILSSEGRGEREPVAPNTTPDGKDNPEGRAQNRRIEIHIVEMETR